MAASDDSAWWMYSYKVQPCPIQERHDWSTCPNAHRGERAARRCPRTYSYTPEPCPEYNKTGSCAHGATCPLAHSVFESWLHPSRFRTQLCCFGASCKRRICFFAHDPSQLRAATHTANSAAAAVVAAAAGAPVLRRTQAVVPASAMAPRYPAGSAGPSALLAATAAMQLAPQAAWQQAAMAGVAASPWLYTSAGWVQATPAMGQAMLVPMASMPAPTQLQQQQVLPTQGSMVAGAPGGAPNLAPMDPVMLSGLAAGLSGLSLQEQAGLSAGAQALACMPGAMLPTSPTSTLLYQQGSETYGIQGPAAVGGMSPAAPMVYMPSPSGASGAAGVERPAQQQQQLMVGSALSSSLQGGPHVVPDPRSQQHWQ